MATSTPLFTISPLIHRQTSSSSKLLVSNPNYKTKSITILCSSSSIPQSSTSLETLAPLPPIHSVDETTPERWIPHRKRKVVMRIAYAGIDFRATKKELELAIYKAGGIHESNFGDSHKMGWATSSLIHEEVNSLSTMVSLKMEIPENPWIRDPKGVALANIVNAHLPKNIRVFTILPSQKRFNVEKECNMRKYGYLLPLEVIGIDSNFSKDKIRLHLSEFNSILRLFEGKNLFHNYTVKPKDRKKHRANSRAELSSESPKSMLNGESESGYAECDGEEAIQTDETVIEHVDDGEHISLRHADSDEKLVEESDSNGNGLSDPPIFAKWLYRPDANDRVFEFHSRTIFQCLCGQPKQLSGASYVTVYICGESFMLEQEKSSLNCLNAFVHTVRMEVSQGVFQFFFEVLKMVGAAVAVKRRLLPGDAISPLSFCKLTRFSLPTAPPELLFLQWNRYPLKSQPDRTTRPEILKMIESEDILSKVDNFYKSIMLPQFSEFLDPLKSPWKEWVETLDANRIPESQLDEVRNAWIEWKNRGIDKAAS